MRTALDRVGATFGRWFVLCAGVTWLQGLLLGSAGFAFHLMALNTLGTDRSVSVGLLLGTLAGLLAATRARTPATPVADHGWLALLLLLWPWWLATCFELVAWFPASLWNSAWTMEFIGAGLGLAASALPAYLLGRLARAALTDARPARTAALVAAAAASLVLMADGFGSRWGVTLPPLCLTALGLLVCWRNGAGLAPDTPASTQRQPLAPLSAWRISPAELPAACALAASLGLAAASLVQLTLELWPPTLQITTLVAVAGLLGAAVACFTRESAAVWFSRAPWAWALMLAAGLCFSPRLVDIILWQNASLLTGWSLELGRAALLLVGVGPLGFWGVVLFRGCVDDRSRGLVGGCAALAWLTAPLVLAAGPLAGLALAAGQALFAGAWSLALTQSRPARWMPWGLTTAALCTVVAVTGTTWDSGRSARLLFSTATVLAHRTGWEPKLLAQLDDARLVAQPAGRQGRWTIWQARGAEWQFRLNGVPRGSFTIAPQWAPQVAPEAAAAFLPMVLVDQPARVLVLGAGTGAGLRTAAAFPAREIVCHEADRALVDMLRGPLAQSCGYDPFAEHCRHVAQPAEWLATPEGDRYDVIVSLPPSSIEQAGLASITADYYARAARRLTPDGIFAQRFSSVDYGPQPLLAVTEALALAFPETACVEVAIGEYLLLGAHRAEVLVRSDLPTRLELRGAHVAASLGWDWSFPLNLPAYDRDALHEAAVEVGATANTAASGRFGCAVPAEMMRWGPKLQETAALLAKPRATPARFPAREASAIPQPLLSTKTPRKSRYLDWIGPAAENGEVLRRLAEVAGRDKLIRDLPDAHWYAYRKELRQQLQEHPRTAVIPVNFTQESADRWHDEDRRRKAYFEGLGELLDPQSLPSAQVFQRLEALLHPTDPLLTLFAHQELAEQYARAQRDPVREREHRLYAIYYSTGEDVSVRNVVVAIERLVEETDASCPPQTRFDLLNGLLQTLRVRWEGRNQRPTKSAKVTLQEIDRSLLAVERAVDVMDPLAVTCAVSPADWSARQQVIERMLARPFRTYRDELTRRVRESELKTRQVLDQAAGEDQSR